MTDKPCPLYPDSTETGKRRDVTEPTGLSDGWFGTRGGPVSGTEEHRGFTDCVTNCIFSHVFIQDLPLTGNSPTALPASEGIGVEGNV